MLPQHCAHCGEPSGDAAYCCAGCRAAAALLSRSHLDRFYRLRQGPGRTGVVVSDSERLPAWLEAATSNESQDEKANRLQALTCRVGGLHCAACSWVIPQLAQRLGAKAAHVNAGQGRLTLHYDRIASANASPSVVGEGFDVAAFHAQLKTLGYSLSSPADEAPSAARPLLLRTGLTIALALNTMLLSLSRYFGLSDVDGALFIAIEAAFMALSVAIGGTYFFKRAANALAQKSLSLDVPIALGIALGALGSVVAWGWSVGATYFDTVTLFIALMLVGRAVQALTAEHAQRQAQAPDHDALWSVRRQTPSGVEIVGAASLKVGDRIEVAPGDLILVDSLAVSDTEVSSEWLDGEPEPRPVSAGAHLKMGTKLCGQSVQAIEVDSRFDAERVRDLLAPPVTHDVIEPQDWLKKITSIYPPAVILLAGLGFGIWYATSATTAFEVMVSLLVITCPCALGLAIPLAYELAAAGTRKDGLLVCRQSVLDRIVHVDTVIFDKTGSATLGELRLENPHDLETLDADATTALCRMVRSSSHPRSRAVSEALFDVQTPAAHAPVVEVPGAGMSVQMGARFYRFGRATFAANSPHDDGTSVLGVSDNPDGPFRPLRSMRFEEASRPQAVEEVRALAELGIEVWILSGDSQTRVSRFANEVGVPAHRALGEMTPSAKADKVTTLKGQRRSVAMVGDGLNDAGALDAADVKGVPALTVPGAARACDVAGLSNSILRVSRLVVTAQRLRKVVRANVAFAAVYNLVAASLALSGLVTPLFASIWMPIGSIAVVMATTLALRPGRNPPRGWAKAHSQGPRFLDDKRNAP